MGSKIHKRDEDTKEPYNVDDQNQSLDFWQPSCQECVDENNERDDSVEDQCALPSSWRIFGVI